MLAAVHAAESLLCRVRLIRVGCVDLCKQFAILLPFEVIFEGENEQATTRDLQLACQVLGLLEKRLVKGDGGLDSPHGLYLLSDESITTCGHDVNTISDPCEGSQPSQG